MEQNREKLSKIEQNRANWPAYSTVRRCCRATSRRPQIPTPVSSSMYRKIRPKSGANCLAILVHTDIPEQALMQWGGRRRAGPPASTHSLSEKLSCRGTIPGNHTWKGPRGRFHRLLSLLFSVEKAAVSIEIGSTRVSATTAA